MSSLGFGASTSVLFTYRFPLILEVSYVYIQIYKMDGNVNFG